MAAAAQALRQVLVGPISQRYGALPVVPLPQDDELCHVFARECGVILKDKGIYRRDRVVVLPYPENREIVVMEAKVFCTWSLHHLIPQKTKYDRNGDPFYVCKDMPTEVAEKTLLSWDFWPQLPEIKQVHPVKMPMLIDGKLSLLDEGYDEQSKTLTFPL